MTAQEVIEARLKEIPVVRLVPVNRNEPQITKAGVVPFSGWERRILLMRPVPKKVDLPPPEWQIAKGTRMRFDTEKKRWVDVKKGGGVKGVEPLVVTALREAWEETGLHPSQVLRVFETGVYGFASASTGKPKTLFLCAAEVPENVALEPFAATTEEIAWFEPEDACARIRADQKPMLESLLESLKTAR